MKTKHFVTTMAVSAAILGAGTAATFAASTTSQSANPMQSLVTAIAQKFNLNESDVQQVFDDQHTQMEADRKQQEVDRLNQAVTDGNLTQAQADAITAKQDELEANRAAMAPPDPAELDNLTEAERSAKREEMKAQMDAQRAELEQWAADNNIPDEYIPFGRGGHHGPGAGDMMHAVR